MKLVSFGQSTFMCEQDVETWNCTNAIIIPAAIRTPIKGQGIESYCVMNKKGQSAYAYCLTTHERDTSTILVPQWLFNQLISDTENIVLKTCRPEPATRIRLRLYTSDIIPIKNVQAALAKYLHLQSNSVISLGIDGKEIQVKVEKTEPNKEFVTLRDSSPYVEFLEPLRTFMPFYSKMASVVGGQAKPEGKTPKEMAAAAALRRLALTQ
jgi:hypothetical protein